MLACSFLFGSSFLHAYGLTLMDRYARPHPFDLDPRQKMNFKQDYYSHIYFRYSIQSCSWKLHSWSSLILMPRRLTEFKCSEHDQNPIYNSWEENFVYLFFLCRRDYARRWINLGGGENIEIRDPRERERDVEETKMRGVRVRGKIGLVPRCPCYQLAFEVAGKGAP